MKLKRLVCGCLVAMSAVMLNPEVTNAEYLTAVEEIKYDKYVVDTDSFFYPDKNDKFHQFNCIVWHYTSAEDKGTPFTFRFKYNNNQWKVAERNAKKELVWVDVENTSIASDVLRVAMPYIGHSAVDKQGKQ